MNRFFILTMASLFTLPALADPNDWVQQQNREVKQEAAKEQGETKTPQGKMKQRMEESPSSTAIGGSRSGELEVEKDQDTEMRRAADKQKFLYQYEDKYRRGL